VLEEWTMQRLIVSLISLAMTLGGFAARAAGDAKAEQLLAQARAALGGDANFAKVRGLTATGTYQREVGDRNLNGELTIDLQLPDKMLRTESMRPMGDATIEMRQGINGDEILRSSRTIGGGPNMMVRIASPGGGADGEAQALRNQRADMARFALALLLTPPSSMPMEYAYGGEAEADDSRADVIDATGPGSFAARLFLDQKTHRPLMLAYRGAAPRMMMRTQRGDGPPPGAGLPPGDPPPPQIVEIQLFLDDYRNVDGVLLPHHLSRSVDGKPNEEITFKTIRINPPFRADAFSVR
jgi:hypothetical protein